MPGEPYLSWPQRHLAKALKGCTSVAFVPYAAVSFSYEQYTQMVSDALLPLGVSVQSVHTARSAAAAIEGAEAVMVGGGNTFKLLATLRREALMEPIRQKVRAGTPYIGWSAGANVACPTIMTTNDMPVVDPNGFDALGLTNYQINPHFTERTIAGHGGESRLQRLLEFTALNDAPVVCLPEGCGIRHSAGVVELLSVDPVKLLLPMGAERWLMPGTLKL